MLANCSVRMKAIEVGGVDQAQLGGHVPETVGQRLLALDAYRCCLASAYAHDLPDRPCLSLTRQEEEHDLGNRLVELGRDHLVDLDASVERLRQGLVLDHGNAVLRGDLADAQGNEVLPFATTSGAPPSSRT